MYTNPLVPLEVEREPLREFLLLDRLFIRLLSMLKRPQSTTQKGIKYPREGE